MDPGVARYLVARLFRAFLTILGIVTIVFLLIRMMPGDPVDTMLGDQAAPEDRAALREALGLDRPMLEQYVTFVGSISDGSLGQSFRRPDETVASLIGAVFMDTAALALASVLLAWLIAVPLGALAAVRRGTGWDKSASTVALIGLAIPTIWLGPLLILAFAVELRISPLPGDDTAGLSALVLPSIAIGTALAAILTRQTRGSMSEVLGEQYVIAARARGLSAPVVIFKHALRNALLPVLTVGAAQLGALLSGAVVAEKIFERPGVGALLVDAVFDRDFPVVQGCVLVFALIYVMINLVVDLVYPLIDPRVRLS
jgi:peptide/nickel transport system permease protein